MSTTGVNVPGAWRDRTNLYISYRQSYAHHPAKRTKYTTSVGAARYTDNDDVERTGLMSAPDGGEGDAVIEMDILPPRWLDLQDDVEAHLVSVAPKIKKLDQLHNKHVLPGFDDESVKAAEAREIETLTLDITREFSACQRAIKRIDVLVRDSGKTSQAEETMAKNLKRSLAARVGEVSTSFRKKQSAYMKKLRQLDGLPGLSSSTSTTNSYAASAQNPYTDPAMLDSEADRSTAQTTLLQTSQLRRGNQQNTAAIAHRESEIEKIAQGVIDLSNLFQDLQTMVIDQGTVLDRIDYNVERTVEAVKGADQELRVATNYQKRSTRRKVIFLLVLIVVGLLTLLLVKPRRSHAAPPPPAAVEHEHEHEEIPGVHPGAGQENGFPPRRRSSRDEDGSSSFSLIGDDGTASAYDIVADVEKERRGAPQAPHRATLVGDVIDGSSHFDR